MPRAAASALGVCAAALAFFLAAPVAAQPKKPLTFDDLAKQSAPAEPAREAPCANLGQKAREACDEYFKAAYEHQAWSLGYRQRAYEAHHSYTFWVFVLVCALVLLGMYLSLREFGLESRRREALLDRLVKRVRGEKVPEPEAETAAVANQLELGASGVKVTSPVLGVIILVVSMGFFYLYLKTVYPIQEGAQVEARPAATTPAPPAK
jgi:hypothetical protein